MNDRVASLIERSLTTLSLLAAALAFSALHDDALAHVALGGLLTYAVPMAVQAVAPNMPRPVALAGALALALGATQLVGCGATVPQIIAGTEVAAEFTCHGARKLCDMTGNDASAPCRAIGDVCAVVAPTSAGSATL